jgi:hypothetical protein
MAGPGSVGAERSIQESSKDIDNLKEQLDETPQDPTDGGGASEGNTSDAPSE